MTAERFGQVDRETLGLSWLVTLVVDSPMGNGVPLLPPSGALPLLL